MATTKKCLKYHQEIMHEVVRWECEKCDYKATRKQSLEIHHESKYEDKKYECDKCEFKVTTKQNLRFHHENIHEGRVLDINVKCVMNILLKREALKNMKNLNVRYECKECNYKATTHGSLRSHLKRRKKSYTLWFQFSNVIIKHDP